MSSLFFILNNSYTFRKQFNIINFTIAEIFCELWEVVKYNSPKVYKIIHTSK